MGPRLVSRGKAIVKSLGVPAILLQWGRDLLVAESESMYRRVCPPALLQWGRDLLVAESRSRRRVGKAHRRFNGAATC